MFDKCTMQFPKITIITPSYNQGQYLEQTILSIISQGYENLEYIIIDGGSTDNSVDIIKKYEDKISYWVSEKDNGQSDAIQKGLSKATGDIFNWINSDDYLEPNALAIIADEFIQNPTKKIICGYTHCFYDEDGSESHTYKMGIKKTVIETIMNVEMNQPGSFYNLHAVRELGGLNESLRYVFDGELWFRFLCKYGLQAVGFTNELIAHFRLHKTSKSVGDGFFEFYKEFLNIHLFIAKQNNLPPLFINYLDNEQYINRYVAGVWDFTMLEKEKLYNFFADKYKYLLYKDKSYADARAGLKESLKNRLLTDWKQQIFLGMKLLLPKGILNAMREIKNR